MFSPNTYDSKVRQRSSDRMWEPGRYDYRGLAHWWAYNSNSVSTAGGRMSSRGTRIYSFSTVIARMFDPPPGHSLPLILISSQNYSPTTARHINAVKSAVSHMTCLYVSEPDPYSKDDYIANLAIMLGDLESLGESYPRRRTDETREQTLLDMARVKNSAEIYAKVFKLRNTKEYRRISRYLLPGDDNFDDFIANEPALRRKREARDRAKRIARAKKAHQEDYLKAQDKLKDWLNGGSSVPSMRFLDKVYLRVIDGYIETTEGANIPLSSAMKAYIQYKRGTLKKGMHVGPYILHGIDDDNSAHIGCHIITLDEIDSLVEVVVAEQEAYKEDARIDRQKLLDDEEEYESLDSLFSELGALMSDMEASSLLSEFSGMLKGEE